MARAGLGLSAADLAGLASVRVATVSHFERGGESYASTVQKLRSALEDRGAIFLGDGEASIVGGPGVRLRAG